MFRSFCCAEKRRLVDLYVATTVSYATAISDRRVLAKSITRDDSERLNRRAVQAYEACKEARVILTAHVAGRDCS